MHMSKCGHCQMFSCLCDREVQLGSGNNTKSSLIKFQFCVRFLIIYIFCRCYLLVFILLNVIFFWHLSSLTSNLNSFVVPGSYKNRPLESGVRIFPGLPGRAGTRRNIHPLTPIVIINHPLSEAHIYYTVLLSTWKCFGMLFFSIFKQEKTFYFVGVCVLRFCRMWPG